MLSFLPFEYISYVPVLIYLGKISGVGILKACALQLIWVVTMLAVGDGMWRWSSRRITIQGG